MLTQQQWMYVGIIVLLLAVGWRMGMLPSVISDPLNTYVPDSIQGVIKEGGCSAAATMSGMPKCEDLATDAQCGMFPSACEFFENKCRSRPLSPAEKGL